MTKKPTAAAIIGGYVAWFGLMALAAAVAIQLNVLLLYLAGELIENPVLRPSGWSSASLVNVQRLVGVTLGSVWLIFILWMENDLRSAAQTGRLRRTVVRRAAVLLGILAVTTITLWLAV